MPVSFIELQKETPQIVPENGTLVFDRIVSSDGTSISYNTNTGVITFNAPAYYYIDWFVAPQFGLTTNGSNWAIQTSLVQRSIIGSSHTKVSVTSGFAIFYAAAGETARLVNVSDGALQLSEAVESKAGLIVYGVATQFATMPGPVNPPSG